MDYSDEFDEDNHSQKTNMIAKVVEKVNAYSEKHIGSSRGIAAETVASIITSGLSKLNDDELKALCLKGKNQEAGFFDYYKDDSEASTHFIDRLMERLLKHTSAEDSETGDKLKERILDKERTNRPGLSFKILASNFQRLSGTMTPFFKLQYGIIHLISWKKPTKTVTALILYTSLCLWPHLILVYPLLYVIFQVFISAYLERHPMRKSQLIKVRKRGQSLWDFLNTTEEKSIFLDYISSKNMITRSYAESSQPLSDPKEHLKNNKKSSETSKYVNSQITLLANMRDLQNLTSDVLHNINLAERFMFETCSFRDERRSTIAFFIIILATFGVLVFGFLIPWRFIFIQTGWCALLACHPNAKKVMKRINSRNKIQRKDAKELTKKEGKDKVKEMHVDPYLEEIIIDDAPEFRSVEVYELQVKSILHGKWEFHLYSNNMYDLNNSDRLASRKPSGTTSLESILPPLGWKFKDTCTHSWKIDVCPERFIKERQIRSDSIFIKPHESEGWICDVSSKESNPDSIYEFRRRRLFRECYRYARPVKAPKYT